MGRRTAWAAIGAAVLPAVAAGRAEEPSDLANGSEAAKKRQAETSERLQAAMAAETTDEGRRAAIDQFNGEVGRNVGEILRLVREHPSDPAAVPALRFVIGTARGGPGDQSAQAAELLKGHETAPGIGELCPYLIILPRKPGADALMRAVLRDNPSRLERGRACYALAEYLDLRAKSVRRYRQDPSHLDRYDEDEYPRRSAVQGMVEATDPEAADREVEALLERVIAEFADLKWGKFDRTMGEVAEGELFARQNLGVGKPAPNILGEDHEGKTFCLSDFRGKVVLLTFSGNWCGPCVAMYPQERALVERMRGRLFAMTSVCTDAKVETLREAIAAGEITWPCWWNGPEGPAGPIATRWGVSAFPAIFVLDAAGVIRFKDLRGEELDRAVDSLVAEAEKG